MSKNIILFIFTLFVISCKTTKWPMGKKVFTGNLKTCILDSTALTTEQIVNIVDLNAKRFINLDCPNKPPSYEYPLTWPSSLYMNFGQSGSYAFMYSPTVISKTNNFKDTNFSIAFNVDSGTLKYNKKKKTVTLTSTKFNWTKTYNISYSKIDSTLTLKE